jgi:peroxiredoxin
MSTTPNPGRAGERAVDFALRDIDGCEHRRDDYLGSWLLLVFHRHLA